MKGILNVLYRRILYKIPLKFLLLLFGICAILFASCNAGLIYNYNQYTNKVESETYRYDGPQVLKNINCSTIWYQCVENAPADTARSLYAGSDGVCLSGYIAFTNSSSCTWGFGYYESEPSTQTECEENYSLIPISSVDSNYCETNNLCPSGGYSSGDVSWSALYINNIQHIGLPNIYIDIPEELSRDYDYTDEDMYIDIEGYNVDYDKITGIINTQNYKPNSEDFNYIVSSIIPLFVPGLVIILFLYWIFRFIKKIF